jgi:hydrogenase nickel incorporation protein HypA/HybF
MHELFVTEQIRDIACRYANEAGAATVADIYVVVGELSAIVDDSVQFYWHLISEGTVAAGAALHFRRLPALLACQQCSRQYGPREGLACPDCGSSDVRVVQGEEFYLEAIDVTGKPAAAAPAPEAL